MSNLKKTENGNELSTPSSTSVFDRIHDCLEDSDLPSVLHDSTRQILDRYGIRFQEEQASLIAYELKKAGADETDVPDLMDRFIGSEVFQGCVHYDRPPAPKEMRELYEKKEARPVDEVEVEYEDYRKERAQKQVKDPNKIPT